MATAAHAPDSGHRGHAAEEEERGGGDRMATHDEIQAIGGARSSVATRRGLLLPRFPPYYRV